MPLPSTAVAYNVTICDNNIRNFNNGNINNNRVIANNGMFRCLFFNAKSLSNKKQLGEFELILRSYKFDIITVCETWLNKSSPDSLLDASGDYAVFRRDRVGRGGCTAFFIRKCENPIAHRVSVSDKFNCIKFIIIDFRSFNSKDFCSRVVLIYILLCAHNSSMFSSFMFEFTIFCASVSYRCCIMADFNLPGVDWVNGLFPNSHETCTYIFENGLHQVVDAPTRKGKHIRFHCS